MAVIDWEVLVVRTVTGEVLDALPGARWSLTDNLDIAEHGTCDVTVPLPGLDRDGRILRASLRALATGMSSLSLVVVADRVALWGGPVVTIGWDSSQVTIGCASLGWVLDRRMITAAGMTGSPADAAADLVLELVPRDLAIELVRRARLGTRRGLPMTLPEQTDMVGVPTTFIGSELRTTYEALTSLSEQDDGPDLHFAVGISVDLATVSWALAVGDPLLGGVNDRAVWDYPLTAVSGDLDESETVRTAYVIGESSGDGGDVRLIGVASSDRGPEWPALERADRTAVSEPRQDVLNALAASYARVYGDAVETIQVGTSSTSGPQYRRDFALGDYGTMTIVGHPWLDDLDATARILSVALDPSRLTVTVAAPRLTGAGA